MATIPCQQHNGLLTKTRMGKSMFTNPEMYLPQVRAKRPDLPEGKLYSLAREVSEHVNNTLAPIKRKAREPLPQVQERLEQARRQAESHALALFPATVI